jgi:hypothetical protein
VSNNCFVGNTADTGGGIFRSGSPALNAINNWWGAATGPSGAGPGTGDAVSTHVTFSPFLTSPPEICLGGQPTNTPTPTNTPAGVATNTPTNTPAFTRTNTPAFVGAVVPTLSPSMIGLLALALVVGALVLMRRS